ncbi:MAG: sensor histidine kinase, partial [Aristaeellaceae bacterium]
LILLPMLLCTLLGQLLTNRSVTQATAAQERSMLNQLETSMNYILDEMDAFVLALDQESVFRSVSDILRQEELSYDRSRSLSLLKDWIMSLVNVRDYIDSIYIYIENGNDRMMHSDDGVRLIASSSDQDWLTIFRDRRGSLTDWTMRRPYTRYQFQSGYPGCWETVSLFRVIRSGRGVIVLNLDPQILQTQLARMTCYDDQQIYVLNHEGELLFANTDSPVFSGEALKSLLASGGEERFFSCEGYACSLLSGSKYGWQYVSVIPEAVLYRLPNYLRAVSLALLAGGVALCVLLAYRHSLRNSRRLYSICSILDAANSNQPLPPLPPRRTDEYSYIEQNILSSYIRQNNLEKQLQDKNYQLKSFELLALQAQINPHFLVNTLNTIFWLSMGLTNGPNPVSEMIEDLTGMLDCLAADPNEVVSLEEETRYLTYYINIQRKRFPDRFDFQADIASECLGLYIPRLTLQPLVENCIAHSLVPDRTVHIRLNAQVDGDMACITVSDDGCGIPPDKLAALRAQWNEAPTYRHIGLVNTVKRLTLFYNLPDAVTVESRPGQGTCITLRLPVRLPDASPAAPGKP